MRTGDIFNVGVQAAQSSLRLQSQADLRAGPGPAGVLGRPAHHAPHGRVAALGRQVSAPSLESSSSLEAAPPPAAHLGRTPYPTCRLHVTALLTAKCPGPEPEPRCSACPAGPRLSARVCVPGPYRAECLWPVLDQVLNFRQPIVTFEASDIITF